MFLILKIVISIVALGYYAYQLCKAITTKPKKIWTVITCLFAVITCASFLIWSFVGFRESAILALSFRISGILFGLFWMSEIVTKNTTQ